MEYHGLHHHQIKADLMFKKVLTFSLIFALGLGSIKAQKKFNFKNDRNFSNDHESLIKLLSKKTIDDPEFQLRLWFGVEPSPRFDHGYGLLLITYKNGKWKANKILITESTRREGENTITTRKAQILPLKPFDIQHQFNALKADGLFSVQSIDHRQLYKLAIKRGYDTNKGFLSLSDNCYGFSVELVTEKAKRSFSSIALKSYYDRTDKLIPELLPLVKIQKRLFNIADVTLGL
jgi:hypothetical protein